jgi:hypothetical protein
MEQRNGRIVESPVEARQGFLGSRYWLFWWSVARLPSSHSRFHSLAFLGTPNRQSGVRFNRARRTRR